MGNKILNSPSCPSYYPVYFFLKFYAQKQLNFFARAKKLESSFFALAKNEKLKALCLCDLCVNLKKVFSMSSALTSRHKLRLSLGYIFLRGLIPFHNESGFFIPHFTLFAFPMLLSKLQQWVQRWHGCELVPLGIWNSR